MEQEACQVVSRPETEAGMKKDVKNARALFTEWKRVAALKLVAPNFIGKKTRADRSRRSGAAVT